MADHPVDHPVTAKRACVTPRCGKPRYWRYKLCRGCRNANVRLSPHEKRRAHLKHRYGITVEQYDEMLAAQGGHCALCPWEPSDGKVLAVDHDHETGRVRGLLCRGCNLALATFERVGWPEAAEEYVGRT